MALTYETVSAPHPAGSNAAPVADIIRIAAIAAVIGSLCFNLFLCFVNTRIMPITDTHVILAEMAVTGTALLAALDRRAGIYVFFALFLAYMLFLFALRGVNDIKAIRDILNPVIFYVVGTRLRDVRLADRLALAAAAIALVFALFEFLMLDVYLDWFNVLGYYISRGTVSLQDSYGATRGLFISGNRPEPRTLLPFLGQQRVSSVFLEPVSMGNFGVILYSWGLFRRECSFRWVLMGAAVAMITLADARFGLATCILITILTPLFRFIPRQFWLIMPFLSLALFAAYGLISGTSAGPNDLSGRFAVTASLMTSVPFGSVLGYEAFDGFTADSGFAYTLTKFAIWGFIGLWAAFVMLPCRDARAWSFHSMMIVYLLLIMIISNSFYSVKTAGLMFFLLGTANAVSYAHLPSLWSRWFERPAEIRRPATG